MADTIRVGVIGAGYWGIKHVEELARAKGASLAAVADLSQQNLECCRKNFGVEKTYSDFNELLADSQVDAVSICTNNEMHYSAAKAALEAGKHVLVEKPLTSELKTAIELVALAKKEKRVLCVGHLFRFNNAVRKLRELYRAGFFGKVYFVKVQFTNHNTMVPGRTVLSDLGPHAFDIQNFILSLWPKKSTYIGSQFRRGEMEEVAFVESEYAGGIWGYSEFSWLLPGKKREVSIVGEKAAARADLGSQKIWADELITDKLNREGNIQKSYGLPVQQNNALAEELESFVQDCRALNIGGSTNSGEVGLKVMEAIAGCKKFG